MSGHNLNLYLQISGTDQQIVLAVNSSSAGQSRPSVGRVPGPEKTSNSQLSKYPNPAPKPNMTCYAPKTAIVPANNCSKSSMSSFNSFRTSSSGCCSKSFAKAPIVPNYGTNVSKPSMNSTMMSACNNVSRADVNKSKSSSNISAFEIPANLSVIPPSQRSLSMRKDTIISGNKTYGNVSVASLANSTALNKSSCCGKGNRSVAATACGRRQ